MDLETSTSKIKEMVGSKVNRKMQRRMENELERLKHRGVIVRKKKAPAKDESKVDDEEETMEADQE